MRESQDFPAQLMVPVFAKGADGTMTKFSALVDTGAQINIVQKGKISHLFQMSKEPVQLITASGSELAGGQMEVMLELVFGKNAPGCDPEEQWTTPGIFVEGEIEEDMILGYPWLAENHVTVCAGRGRLMVGDTPCDLVAWQSSSSVGPLALFH